MNYIKQIFDKIEKLENKVLVENKELFNKINQLQNDLSQTRLKMLRAQARIYRECQSCKRFNILNSEPTYKQICSNCYRLKKLKEQKKQKLVEEDTPKFSDKGIVVNTPS